MERGGIGNERTDQNAGSPAHTSEMNLKWHVKSPRTGLGKSNQNTRSFAALRISPAGSDARKAAQLAEKNSSLYTWGFPETVQTRSPRGNHGAGRING